MKKFVCKLLVVMCVISLLLTGCENTKYKTNNNQNSLELNYSTDMQIMYLCSGGNIGVPMTKSDTGYYYIGKGISDTRMIIYIDKESKKATPLCSKPNCIHDDIEECDAYVSSSSNLAVDTIFGATGNLIQYYEGSLYLLCAEYDKSFINYNTYILKMDLDGGNRTQITEYFDFPVTRWCLHRGYFYYVTDSSLLRIPADSLKSEPEVVYEAEFFEENSENTFRSLYAYKNYVYFQVDEKDDKGNGDGRKTLCINLDTMEKTEIKVNEKYGVINGFIGDKLMISKVIGNEKVYQIADLNGKNSEQLFTQNEADKTSVTFDGTYYYSDNHSQTNSNSDVEQVITVFDTEFNEIDTFRLPQLDMKVYSFFAPQDEDFFIFECFNENDEHVIVMADKSQIGSINGDVIEYTELCKLKWVQNNSNGIYYTE